jgi:hypothetical protein
MNWKLNLSNQTGDRSTFIIHHEKCLQINANIKTLDVGSLLFQDTEELETEQSSSVVRIPASCVEDLGSECRSG